MVGRRSFSPGDSTFLHGFPTHLASTLWLTDSWSPPSEDDGRRPLFWNKAVISSSAIMDFPPPSPSPRGKGNLWKRSCWVIDFSVNMMSERKTEVITSNALQLLPLPPHPPTPSNTSPFNFHLKQNSCHRPKAKNRNPFQLLAN